MKIYLWQDNRENGPFTWVEIFVMLRKGEIDDQARVRLNDDPDFKSIEEHDLWREGNEVGPFEWDDILLLLQEGVLDYEVQARKEGDPKLSSLAEVIAGSEEVSFFANQESSEEIDAMAPQESAHYEEKPSFLWRRNLILAVAACIVAFLALILHKRLLEPIPSRNVAQNSSSLAVANEASDKDHAKPATSTEANTVPAPARSDASEPISKIEKKSAISALPPSATHQSQAETSLNGDSLVPPTSAKSADESAVEIALVPSGSNIGTAPQSQPLPLVAAAHQPVGNTSPKNAPLQGPTNPIPTMQDFFCVESVKFLKKEPKDAIGMWNIPPKNIKPVLPPTFVPCLEATISAKENTRTDKLFARAYFYDESNNIIASARPGESGKKGGSQYALPVLLHKDKPERIFFPIPAKVGDKPLKVVVVFGDVNEAKVACYPSNVNDFLLDYPEKKYVYNRVPKSVVRRAAIDPLVEYVVKTRNPKNPQITLFLRPPLGISDGSEIKGVIALSLLAGSLEEIKRQLQSAEMDGDYTGILGFANKHKLAIVAWGSTSSLWNRANYNDVTSKQAREVDKSFDMVADAWERGVKELGEKYGIPTKDFLLWGQCGSAHWAHALCLHKPDYFLAIDVHIPGYFEKPTPEAAKVLWCITTGENYGAYQNSLRFVADCKKLGYPIVYKAIVGLGHAGHPDATAMGFEFFEFALTMKDLRDQYDRRSKDVLAVNSENLKSATPWPEIFQHPPFYADIVNQRIYPSSEVDMIPEGFRVPIPTKKIGDIWTRSDPILSK